MARRGFFRRIADAVTRVFDRFTEPETPAPQPTKRRRRRIARRPTTPRAPAPRLKPSKDEPEHTISADWGPDWLELDQRLIDEVIADLLADLDAKGYI